METINKMEKHLIGFLSLLYTAFITIVSLEVIETIARIIMYLSATAVSIITFYYIKKNKGKMK
ncbi:MAG: hypothetical protein H3C35_13410 [Bacteroidetes bacterium]|nr:hypothetical protein [Bacteroidota bacterium]